MKFLLLIHQGDAPTPDDPEAWSRLTEEEQQAIYAAYQAINQTPGVIAGERLAAPESAVTVRVENGEPMVTDGPFAETKEAVGGYLIFEAGDREAVIELAARVPAARLGGAIEVRPFLES
jgi:hypothetical protein